MASVPAGNAEVFSTMETKPASVSFPKEVKGTREPSERSCCHPLSRRVTVPFLAELFTLGKREAERKINATAMQRNVSIGDFLVLPKI